MTIRSILVATDLSLHEEHALQRGWQIAAAHGASLKLMYLPAAGAAVPPGAATRIEAVARQLEQRVPTGVPAVTLTAEPGFDDLVKHSRGMDLVVLPHRRERSTAAFFRGQPVMRLLRSAGSPVLVVRRSGDVPYRHVLVGVDFSALSNGLVRFADRLAADATLELFHALSTSDEARLRAAEATEQAVLAYRTSMLRRAEARMLTLSDSFSARRNRLQTFTGRGDAGQQVVVQQERSGADLVVVGKRSSSAWGDFLGGSVAHRVLSWGRGDMLVVPHTYLQPAAAPVARRFPQAPASSAPTRVAGRRAT